MGFGIIHNKSYLEQYERIKRWHQILNEMRVSDASEDKTEYQVDCIYAFFMNCFHLTDWLKRSKTSVSVKTIDSFINNHEEMQICKYLCLGVKHLRLDEKRHSVSNTVSIGREYDPFAKILGNKNPVKDITYSLDTKYGKFNVFELADICVKLWEDFLKQHNLIKN